MRRPIKTRPLVVITTRLPPATCGIGAHSLRLRQHWPGASRAVEFLVVDDRKGDPGLVGGDYVTSFAGQRASLARELRRLGTADVLLHYAGRAYQRFDCPVWMPGIFAHWKKQFPESRLMIFVHELPGAMPVTSRHFWLGRVNEWIIQRLATSADVLVTNTELHIAQLRKITGRKDIHLFPVGSNIETAAKSTQLRPRTEFVLFGLPFGRWQTLQLFDEYIRRWSAAHRLTKLHIVGPEDAVFASQARDLMRRWPNEIVVEHHGALPSAEVGTLLRQAGFALTNATRATWSKSGSFMACAANECPVIVQEAAPDLIPLSYAVAAEEIGFISDAEIARRSTALARWYRENADWHITAQRIANLFGRTTAVPSSGDKKTDGTAPIPPSAI